MYLDLALGNAPCFPLENRRAFNASVDGISPSSTHVLQSIEGKATVRAVKIVASVIDLLLGCNNNEGKLDEWGSTEPRLYPSELAIVTDSPERRGTPLSNKLLQTLDQATPSRDP
jgi:hypothetical protein